MSWNVMDLFFENNGPRANARPPANSDSKEKA